MAFDRAKPVTAYIGLGGNVGDVVASMVKALEGLDAHDRIAVTARSSLYQTPPWGDVDQDDFINACARLETSLSPPDLLEVMKEQEKRLKRRKTRRWGPRTIDLDILMYGNQTFAEEGLEIPHPRMTDRAFVLLPLLAIVGDEQVFGQSIAGWMKNLDTSDIVRLGDTDGWRSGKQD